MQLKKFTRSLHISILTISCQLLFGIQTAQSGGEVDTGTPQIVAACQKAGGTVAPTPEYYSMYSNNWCSIPEKDRACMKTMADSYEMTIQEYIEEIGAGGEIISYYDFKTQRCYE